MKKIFIILSLISGLTYLGIAQDKVNGRITAFNKYGLNNVEIIAKKSKQTVFSDSIGNFSIKCSKNETLKFNAKGFYGAQIKSNEQKNLKINLIFQGNSNAKNIAVSNNHIKLSDLEYAINNLSDENNSHSNYQNIIDLIQSVYPSASINKSGYPIKIYLNSRGPNSLTSGEEALIVVDKIITENITDISPTQVKKITVLLGADASYYGVRGGNGVIEIELKH